MQELLEIYNDKYGEIKERLADFERIKKYATEEQYFAELAFCLFTPQSKARMAEKAVSILQENGHLYYGLECDLVDTLAMVRFKNHKASYLVKARQLATEKGVFTLKSRLDAITGVAEKRLWLFENICGFGLKEASHFLRNTGFGQNIAILDRHIFRNLLQYKVIDALPKNLNLKTYLEIEDKFMNFARQLNIPPDYLDFVILYKEIGDIFK